MENPRLLKFTVPAEFDGALLKSFLRRGCGLSSHLMVSLKQTENGILRNGRHARVIERVAAGDMVTLRLPEETCAAEPAMLPLTVIYEDAHLLVLDKPPGMPVHPTSCGHQRDTLANAVSFYMRKKGERYAFRPLNRLDKDTTGLVLAAKEPYSAFCLKTGVEKQYIAVCEGIFQEAARWTRQYASRKGIQLSDRRVTAGSGLLRTIKRLRAIITIRLRSLRSKQAGRTKSASTWLISAIRSRETICMVGARNI